MNPQHAQQEFERFLAARDVVLEELTPPRGLALMMDFYLDVRAEDCALDDDGDMLLFQWGTYDWGHGEHFEFDITRQLVFPDDSGEADRDEEWDPIDDLMIWQLSLTFVYEPSLDLERLQSGNRWCETPGDLHAFRDHVLSSAATAIASSLRPVRVELDYELAE